jgi:hypothetical protein
MSKPSVMMIEPFTPGEEIAVVNIKRRRRQNERRRYRSVARFIAIDRKYCDLCQTAFYLYRRVRERYAGEANSGLDAITANDTLSFRFIPFSSAVSGPFNVPLLD